MIEDITIEQARKMTVCPCCNAEKRLNLVVCWECWREQPRCSSIKMTGFKHWDGTLTDFIVTANIPF